MNGLFRGMNALVDDYFRFSLTYHGEVPRFQLAISLLAPIQGPTEASGNLVDLLFEQAVINWDNFDHATRGRSSAQNWRTAKRPPPNFPIHTPTTLLNQAITTGSDEQWSNRIPVDAGMLGSCGQRKIALAERREAVCSVIELATTDNTPLAMAIRCLQHCVAYLFFRSRMAEVGAPEWTSQSPPELLTAERLTAAVLAPRSYYARFERSLEWLQDLEKRLNRDLMRADVCRETQLPVAFQFEIFPDDFEWTVSMAETPNGQLDAVTAFADRKRLFVA